MVKARPSVILFKLNSKKVTLPHRKLGLQIIFVQSFIWYTQCLQEINLCTASDITSNVCFIWIGTKYLGPLFSSFVTISRSVCFCKYVIRRLSSRAMNIALAQSVINSITSNKRRVVQYCIDIRHRCSNCYWVIQIWRFIYWRLYSIVIIIYTHLYCYLIIIILYIRKCAHVCILWILASII